MSTAKIYSDFWEEEASSDNPFSPSACYCAGFNVYEDLLNKVSWVEYLYLMLIKEAPNKQQSALLNALSVALANPGPRDPSVQAAMSAGAGGSTLASSLIAAISVGAGNLGGAHEVAITMNCWQQFSTDITLWKSGFAQFKQQHKDKIQPADVWLPIEHAPGFDPNGIMCPDTIIHTLGCLAALSPNIHLTWLKENRKEMEGLAKAPLSISGVAAAAFYDLGFEPAQAEMLYMLLRLPGAAAHALEQHETGWQKFPFFSDGLFINKDQIKRHNSL
mgnify:FL=1